MIFIHISLLPHSKWNNIDWIPFALNSTLAVQLQVVLVMVVVTSEAMRISLKDELNKQIKFLLVINEEMKIYEGSQK